MLIYLKRKIKQKKGITELVTVIILLIVFASVSGFCAKAVIGNTKDKEGVLGAGESVNNAILTTIP